MDSTLSNGTEVVIGTNGYDEGTPEDPYVFTGQTGVVVDVKANDPTVYYVAFDDPRVNGWYGEPLGTPWPFYAQELKVKDDA